MPERMTIQHLHAMKKNGEKIAGVVAWDYQIARIADEAGVEIVSVGDTVGMNLWGHENPFEITMDEMVTVAKAVRRGTRRALVSCDFPYGPLQEGKKAALKAAIRLMQEAGVDMVKLDGAADYPETVAALARAGIPVWAQFGVTPQTSRRYGIEYAAMAEAGAQVASDMQERLVAEARALEAAGAVLLDFTNSGPVVGPAVAQSVSIPVLGGFGGGPWLDGRVRMAHAAIGYGAKYLDGKAESYANVARITLQALSAFRDDVRAGRRVKGDATPRS
jgi:3-methyl-2-oxobutanoate hydroxymethyltransferase